MNSDLKSALQSFQQEVEKDIWFFGSCGVAVGLFMLWQSRFKELGLATDPQWASELFADFLSFNAFGLIFFGYLLIASLATIFFDLGHPIQWLERASNHMEIRLAQIASSLVSFILGFLGLIIVYSILTLEIEGLKVIAFAILYTVVVVGSFVIALLVGRRSEPYDRWWAALLAVVIVGFLLGKLLLQSSK